MNGVTITAVVLTKDEEANLPACLESLKGWCRPVFVVDSGSTDGTERVAKSFGAEFVSHPFETHSKQWNWALRNLPFKTAWVLAIDADQRITPQLKEELLKELAETDPQISGYYLPRKQIFRGRWIRHGGYWPKYLLKLFRTGAARCDEQELLDFRFYVDGKTVLLKEPLVEENLKEREILFWLGKHLRFIELLAREELSVRTGRRTWQAKPDPAGTPDQRVLWKKNLWYKLPLYTRPFLYFAYRYFLLLGFLDGRQGALFHFLQAFWLRMMVDVRLGELLRAKKTGR